MSLQCLHSLLVLFLLLLLNLQPSLQQKPSTSLSPSDLQSLFDIRNALHGLPGSTFFASWDFTAAANPCTSFAGILCSPDPSDSSVLRVSVLTLGTGLENSPGLSGSLPPSIANLTALTQLVVFPGRVSGPIPPEIGLKCRYLSLVSISNNLVSGPIPDSFGSLSELHTLDLSHNKLTGTVPDAIFSSLPNLRVLVLATNSLYGQVPSSISSSSLFHVDLHKNFLSGLLPQLPSTLRYLSVAQNSFSGPINAAFSSEMLNLTYIDLSLNRFSGKIPTGIFALPLLLTILLQRNNFSGPLILPGSVPSWLIVDLSHNAVAGSVPAQLAEAESLYLNSNRLLGSIPREIVEKVRDGSLTTFYAQHNFLSGFDSAASEQWGPLPESVSVCLSFNCMVVPAAAEGGCPASAGTQEARPKEQCPQW